MLGVNQGNTIFSTILFEKRFRFQDTSNCFRYQWLMVVPGKLDAMIQSGYWIGHYHIVRKVLTYQGNDPTRP